jgi:hypothetical protein
LFFALIGGARYPNPSPEMKHLGFGLWCRSYGAVAKPMTIICLPFGMSFLELPNTLAKLNIVAEYGALIASQEEKLNRSRSTSAAPKPPG